MNRKALSVLCSVLLAGAWTATAQTTASTAPATGGQMVEQSKETTRKVKGEGKTKTKAHSWVGTVTDFEAGKSMKIKDARNKSHSFDLNASGWTVTVDPSVAVGSKVKITEMTGDDQTKTRTVEPYTAMTKHKKSMKATS